MHKILIVDDEPDIVEFLSYNLKKDGFETDSCNNGKDAIAKAIIWHPNLILLDIMMPEMDGIETCHEIRKNQELKNTIIAFLTARGEDYSQIAAFEAGADDFITKPVRPKVLISRIKALLKRAGDSNDNLKNNISYEIQESNQTVRIDKERYAVYKNNKEIVLPKKEFELLSLLASKPERVFMREEIFHTIWDDNVIVGERTIDVHIRKLREKVGANHIVTVKGVGYKFVE
jgi:two-component system, OmpR family, alkaline phosphatase synthesis response regulator PhoP